MNKPVIAVLDDQLFICEMIEIILKDSYEVHKFLHGKDAIKFVSEHPVDLIFLDYDMPEMTGYEALMAIRASKAAAETPIIFLTAQNNERMKAEMLERGANDYICKPIDSNELRRTVKKFIK